MFDNKFLKNLPNEPLLATKELCEKFLKFHDRYSFNPSAYEEYSRAIGILEVLIKQTDLVFTFPELGAHFTIETNISRIVEFITLIQGDIVRKLSSLKSDSFFALKFGKEFAYVFSDDDFDRVQQLITELREIITKSKDFEKDYKFRLLKKLEKLQSELNKKMSDLDRYSGVIIDLSVVIGSCRKNIKPSEDSKKSLLELLKELKEIFWRTKVKAEGLPSNAQLPLKDNVQIEES